MACSFARMRSRWDFRLIWNLPRRATVYRYFRFHAGQHRPQGWLRHRYLMLGLEKTSTRCAWRQLGRTSPCGDCKCGQVECATVITNRFSHIRAENNKQIIGTGHFCSNLQARCCVGAEAIWSSRIPAVNKPCSRRRAREASPCSSRTSTCCFVSIQ